VTGHEQTWHVDAAYATRNWCWLDCCGRKGLAGGEGTPIYDLRVTIYE
jgi:hypothetical protein